MYSHSYSPVLAYLWSPPLGLVALTLSALGRVMVAPVTLFLGLRPRPYLWLANLLHHRPSRERQAVARMFSYPVNSALPALGFYFHFAGCDLMYIH